MPTDMLIQASKSPGVASHSGPAVVKTAGAPVFASTEQSTEVAEEAVSTEALSSALEQVSSYVQNVQRNLNFSIDEASGRTVVKVIDSESDEVIRQIPAEEMLAVARRLQEMNEVQIPGLLLRSKV